MPEKVPPFSHLPKHTVELGEERIPEDFSWAVAKGLRALFDKGDLVKIYQDRIYILRAEKLEKRRKREWLRNKFQEKCQFTKKLLMYVRQTFDVKIDQARIEELNANSPLFTQSHTIKQFFFPIVTKIMTRKFELQKAKKDTQQINLVLVYLKLLEEELYAIAADLGSV